MTPEKAKEAAVARLPVVYQGKKYERILAIIWRMPYPNQRAAGAGFYQVELLEYSGSAVVIADPEGVEVGA